MCPQEDDLVHDTRNLDVGALDRPQVPDAFWTHDNRHLAIRPLTSAGNAAGCLDQPASSAGTQEIGFTDEAGDEMCCRAEVDLLR